MSSKKSKTNRDCIFTKDQFQNLSNRYGFTCVEKGSRQQFNAKLTVYLNKVIAQAMISADHSGRKGLHGIDAQFAIESIPQMPIGAYTKKSSKKKKRSRDEMEQKDEQEEQEEEKKK